MMNIRRFLTLGVLVSLIGISLGLGAMPGRAHAAPLKGAALALYIEEASGTWYTGTIDFIDDKRISIADVSHQFSGDVIFVSRHGDRVSRRYFPVGRKVKMLLNGEYRCHILLEL